jgi:sugar phosphate permease
MFFPQSPPRAAAAVRSNEQGTLLRTPASWLAFATYGFFNVAFWGFNAWVPTYLNETRHIDIKSLGNVAFIPYFCGFIGLLVIGWLGHRPLLRARAPLAAAAYVLAGIGLYIAFSATTATYSVIGLSFAAFFLYGTFGPFWAVALGVTPDGVRGTFSGFVNFGGQIGGFVAPLIVGALVDRTHSFTLGFEVMMAALVVAAGCAVALGRADRLHASGA